MRWISLPTMALVLAASALEARADLDGDSIVVTERFPTATSVLRPPQLTIVQAGNADAVVTPGQNATTIDVDPESITLTFGCDFPVCNRITTSAEFNGFAVSDLDWSEPPGPPVAFEIESSLYFDPARVQLGADEILIDGLFSAFRDQDYVRIDLVFRPQVSIDIVPGRGRNVVRKRGLVPVAILGSPELDVTEVDPFSLRFGPGEAMAMRSNRWVVLYRLEVKDVDRDGHDDLTTWFQAAEAAVPGDASEACLRGEVGGLPFDACDAVESRRGRP